MDKVYVDTSEKTTSIEVPEYGEINLIIKEGKVVKYNITHSLIVNRNDQKTLLKQNKM